MFGNLLKMFLITFVLMVFVKSCVGCRCDARLGFGTICGHRLSVDPSDGCQPNSLYFCDQKVPNGLAQEVKNCLIANQFCIYGWLPREDIQSDVCVNYFANGIQNLSSMDFQSSLLMTPRAWAMKIFHYKIDQDDSFLPSKLR